MTTINILSPGFTSPNSAAFLFPLIVFRRALKAHNINIKIINTLNEGTTQCDYLLIDSKYFKHHWAQGLDKTIETITNLNNKTKVIWCDQADSTGTFLGQVVPHVHKYLKAQLLKEKKAYMQPHYASRVYTDYYHKKHEISDDEPYIRQPIQDQDQLKKLDLSWNSGLMHYGLIGPYLQRIYAKFPFKNMLHFSGALKRANTPRQNNITCRMGIPYSRATARFQREEMRKILSKHLPTDKLSRRAYFKELTQSKICVSPFGLGEITLKDFECFLTGAVLLKPDMSHMDTWPNLFIDNETCLFHDWDLSTVQEKIEWALDNRNHSIEIAQNGQNTYLDYTAHKNAGDLFAQHFIKCIST